jgi:capsid protein
MILNQYGQEIKQDRAHTVLARYDAAQTTPENAAHWSMSTIWDADREADPATRSTLRSRARYESANNPWLQGMIQTKAFDIIGTGPRLQVLTPKEKLNNAIEAEFIEWAKRINLAEKLHTLRMAQSRDGEAFAVLISNGNLPGKIKLDLQLVEADCISASYRSEIFAGNEVDGIRYDIFGNPVSYNVIPHPGSGNVTGKGIRIAAENIIHLYLPERPGQHRGVPEITAALPLLAMLRRYTLAMVKKMETSANISGVIHTGDTGDGNEENELEEFTPFSLPRDAFAALPKGYSLQSHAMTNPTDSQREFALQVKTELARCLNLPKNVALGDSSSYNYASGRMDYQAYDKYLNVERMRISNTVLSRIMQSWLGEFWPQSSYKRIEPLDYIWFWDGRAHVDPVKEANAEMQRLLNGTTTLAIECARQGYDWEQIQDQRLREELREIQQRKQIGLPEKGEARILYNEPDEPQEQGGNNAE